MLINQIKEVFSDKKLLSYWPTRGVNIFLSTMYGILLSGMGFEASEILISWLFLFFGKTIILTFDELFVSKIKNKIYLLGALFTLVYMSITKISLIPFACFVVLIEPISRDIIASALTYTRSKNWVLGKDSATSLVNEFGKSMGIIFSVIVGFIILVDQKLIIPFFFVILIIYFFSISKFSFFNGDKKNNSNLKMKKDHNIYILLLSSHNAMYYVFNAVVSISMIKIFNQAGIDKSAVLISSLVLGIVMVVSILLINKLKKNKNLDINKVDNANIWWISLILMWIIGLSVLILLFLFNNEVISTIQLAYIVAILLGLFNSIGGGLHGLGMSKILDRMLIQNESKNEMFKNLMNKGMLFSNLIVLIPLSLVVYFSKEIDLIKFMEFSLPIFLIIEGVLIIGYYRLSQRYNEKNS